MSRHRGYSVTINNPTEEDRLLVAAAADNSTYLIVGEEVGAEGTQHLQIFVYYENNKAFNAVKKAFPRAHIEFTKGTPQQNITYCKKEGNFKEYGVPPKQGRRSDVDTVVESLKQGSNLRDVIDNATSYQSIKIGEVWLKYNEKGKDWAPEVRWYHGSTGSGKTKAAIEWLGSDYYTPINFKWWEGYDAHENVLLDEVRGDFCKYHEMLRLIDRYQYKIECKGGSRQLLAKKIAITSPYHPIEVYKTIEDTRQLVRRISEIVQVGDPVHRSSRVYDNIDHLEM